MAAIIAIKWNTYAKAYLLLQYAQYLTQMVLFIIYVAFAVYNSNPAWTTKQMARHPAGVASSKKLLDRYWLANWVNSHSHFINLSAPKGPAAEASHTCTACSA